MVLGGVMAAQPLTGRSLAQHTYMFAGEVCTPGFPAAHLRLYCQREVGRTVLGAQGMPDWITRWGELLLITSSLRRGAEQRRWRR